jgi:hypothetical protein
VAKVWPTADDFVFPANHRRNIISFLVGTLNSAAALLNRSGLVRGLLDRVRTYREWNQATVIGSEKGTNVVLSR